MTVNALTPQRPINAPVSTEQVGSVRNARSTDELNPAAQARKRYLADGETQFQGGTLSAPGHELAKAAAVPGKIGAPGVQVSTFAVDGRQSHDMLVIKRVPSTEEGPNFVVYMPEVEVTSFHEFNTAEEMTQWIKDVAHDPTERARFARHFSQHPYLTPRQEEWVSQKLGEFAAGDTNAVVGSFGYEKGDIFERLTRPFDVAPVKVNGLSRTKLFKREPDGNATYIGFREDGKRVLYKYDAYGNFHGSSGKDWYFVQNGLNENKPLIPMTLKKYTDTVTSASLDNVGANDRRGLYAEFLKQLRNPGQGLATVMKVAGVSDDVASSIAAILKNPCKGTLLELNQNNRIGALFGVDKDTMDKDLEETGSQIQRHIPHYGKWRKRLNKLADGLEKHVGSPKEPTTQVNT